MDEACEENHNDERNRTMKKILMIGAAIAVMTTSANAWTNVTTVTTAPDGPGSIDFRTLKDFTLECESNHENHRRINFTIKPSEMKIELHNDKGENIEFFISDAMALTEYGHNEFGHMVQAPSVKSIHFLDKGMKSRIIMFTDINIYYGPGQGNTESWSWSCIR
jgi:hypothetical protein